MSDYRRMIYRDFDVPKSLIDDLRNFIGDTPERNRLVDGTELSDAQIRLSIQLFLSHFNNAPPRLDGTYGADNFPDYHLLFMGSIATMLKSAGIYELRNSIDVQDSGLMINLQSKGPLYDQASQVLMDRVAQQVDELKQGLNAEEGYRIAHSPENMWWPYIE
jgi:hypothetical protein